MAVLLECESILSDSWVKDRPRCFVRFRKEDLRDEVVNILDNNGFSWTNPEVETGDLQETTCNYVIAKDREIIGDCTACPFVELQLVLSEILK